jgi:hypothetical protein
MDFHTLNAYISYIKAIGNGGFPLLLMKTVP